MLKLFQWTVFILLEIAFLPLMLIGIVFSFVMLYANRKRGSSSTAFKAIQSTWLLHQLGHRSDPLSVRFINHYPYGWILWCFFLPMILAHKICGFSFAAMEVQKRGREGHVDISNLLNIRTVRMDELVSQYATGVEQIVLMGAGYDLRMHSFSKAGSIKIFELDQKGTQELKLKTLKKARIPSHNIQYIPVDFEKESWPEKLRSNGFDPSKPTYFHWESVSLYLTEHAVRETLRNMAALCATGSFITQDFYSLSFVAKGEKRMEKMGEPWRFGLDMQSGPKEEILSLLEPLGLTMEDCLVVGPKASEKDAIYAIAVAKKL